MDSNGRLLWLTTGHKDRLLPYNGEFKAARKWKVNRFQSEHEGFGMIGKDFMCDLKWESDYEILFG